MVERATVISPVLLQLLDENKPVSRAFSLGMEDWLDETAFVTEPNVPHSSNNDPHPPNPYEPRPKRL